MEVAAELAEVAGDGGDDDGLPEQEGARLFGHSKDYRDDLPQVVIAMAVTRDGIPVRCWTFPGNTADQKIIRKVKDDLAGWNAPASSSSSSVTATASSRRSSTGYLPAAACASSRLRSTPPERTPSRSGMWEHYGASAWTTC
jgi:hypothetical protein